MLVEDRDKQAGKGEHPLSEGGGRQTMHVLVYGNQGNIVTQRLKEAIRRVVPLKHVEEYQTVESLSNGLRRPLLSQAITILLAENRGDLAGLLSIGDLLWDIPLILILPDSDEETISTAHTLRPRFLTFADSDFADLAAVLGKMLEYLDSRRLRARN
jgi:hypothetical protein